MRNHEHYGLQTVLSMTYCNCKVSDSIVCQYLLVSDDDLEWPIIFLSRLRPVLLTLDSASLLTVGEHDYCRGSLLPHHPPEVNHSVGEGTYMCKTEISWTSNLLCSIIK